MHSSKPLSQWVIPSDETLKNLKENWFNTAHPAVTQQKATAILDEWFKSTKLNYLHNWDSMPYIDITMGCAHYIESFILGQHSLDNFQVLPDEYAYYSFMGKWGTEAGSLEKNKPLIVTLPHFKWGDIRPGWDSLLRECEQKNIDVHLDMAWLTLSRGIEIDLGHPSIRSIGLGLSKLDCQWNRVGIRYTKQRKLDSITIFNHFYTQPVNENIYAGGAYIAKNISRDYLWETYADKNKDICQTFKLKQTKLVHGGLDTNTNTVLCLSNLL